MTSATEEMSSWVRASGVTWSFPQRQPALTPLTVARNGYVWSALNVIAGDIGQIPLKVMRVDGEVHTPDRSHPLWNVLAVAPNEYQTPCAWKEWAISTALIWGNSLSYIRRDARSRVIALDPIMPETVGYGVGPDGVPYYTGMYGSDPVVLSVGEVVHLKGLAENGFWGTDLLTVAADMLQLGRSVVRHAAKVFENGARPGGVLTTDKALRPELRAQLRTEFENFHRGSDNSHRTAVMSDGLKYEVVGASNADAQLMEILENDPQRIASLFQIAPHRLGDYRFGADRANIEESNRQHWSQALRRRVNAMAEELNRKLIANPARYTIQPDPSEILKGDLETMVTTARNAVEARLWTRNEGRAFLGFNPVDDGDTFSNPNIDAATPQPADSGGAAVAQAEPTGGEEDAENARILARASHAAEVERVKLVRAAKNSRNFIGYVERLYDKRLPELIAESFAGEDVAGAEVYCAARKAAMIDLAGAVAAGDRETLATLVDRACKGQAKYLAATILRGEQ